MGKHTPEPWTVTDCRHQKHGHLKVFGAVGSQLASVFRTGPHPEEDANRIAVCVNACAGIPTDTLEAGVVVVPVEEIEDWKRRLAEVITAERYVDGYIRPMVLTREERVEQAKEVHAALSYLRQNGGGTSARD